MKIGFGLTIFVINRRWRHSSLLSWWRCRSLCNRAKSMIWSNMNWWFALRHAIKELTLALHANLTLRWFVIEGYTNVLSLFRRFRDAWDGESMSKLLYFGINRFETVRLSEIFKLKIYFIATLAIQDESQKFGEHIRLKDTWFCMPRMS